MYKPVLVSGLVRTALIATWVFIGGVAIAMDGQMRATEILAQADEARGNLDGVEWQLHLHAEDSKDEQEMTMAVQARGFDVVTTTLAPAHSKGNRLLMLKENMWFDKPGLNKPVPISKRQKLMGTAAYGDIASTDYANDYNATLLGEDDVEGKLCWVYDLQAKHRNVTYDRIKYWVEKDKMIGVKADYFTVSGKKFKSAKMEYANRVERNGQLKPFISSISISGELLQNERTVLTLRNPVLRKIPDYVFDLSLNR
ncbi:MAG: outer membrane lipoprotein-sorting protein [Chromatiaceae bacterium]